MNIFVLYNFSGSKENLSRDTVLRIEAVSTYTSKFDVSNIFFVGGEFGRHISGAKQMMEHYKRNYENSATLQVLGSFDTESNISTILAIVKKLNESDRSIIVTSGYHVDRIKSLISNFSADVLSAEDILLKYGNDKMKTEIKMYCSSFGYRWKIIREYFLILLFKSIILKKMFKVFRQISYD
jgi:hypothetical protein